MESGKLRTAIREGRYTLKEFDTKSETGLENEALAKTLLAKGSYIEGVILENGNRRRFYLAQGKVLVVDYEEVERATIVLGKFKYTTEKVYQVREMIF